MATSLHTVSAVRVARSAAVLAYHVVLAADKRRGFYGSLANRFPDWPPGRFPLFLQKLLLLGSHRELEPPSPGRRPPQEFLAARAGKVTVGLKVRCLAASSASPSSSSSSSTPSSYSYSSSSSATTTTSSLHLHYHGVPVGLALTLEEHLALVVVDGLVVAERGRGALRGPVEGLGLALGHARPAEGARAARQAGHLAVLAAHRLQLAGPQLPVLARQPVGHHVPLALRQRMLVLSKCCFTSTENVGLLGTGAQDGHLDFHTAPELCAKGLMFLYVIYVSLC